MDVEKLRKVNQLSAELRRHNMASSSDEAFDQAEKIIHQQEVREFLQRSKEVTESTKNPTADHLYQVNLERQNRYLNEQIQKLNGQLEQLKAEVEQLKQTPKAQPIQIQAAPKVEKQAVLQSKTEEPHPKQGNFSPDDVSIEKMFYFGNK